MKKEQKEVSVSADLTAQLPSIPQLLSMSEMLALQEHEFASLLPGMTDDEQAKHVEDVREKGQMVPIVLCNGKVLDGRHTLKSCIQIGIECKFEVYKGKDPSGYVRSKNAIRRHLTPSQLAAVGVEELPRLEDEAEKRKASTLKKGDKPVREIIPQREKGKATEKAAEIVGVNPRYVSDAKKIKEKDPEAFEEIKKGTKTIAEVKRQQKAKKDKHATAAADVVENNQVALVKNENDPIEKGLKLIAKGIAILYGNDGLNDLPTVERGHVLSAIDESLKNLEEIRERINTQE